jgi:hypothetical protein
VQDLPAIRRACQPIAAWWDTYLTTGAADPDALDDALADARALGPITGRLGEALAYIIAGCLPNLNYSDASSAFDRVAAIGRGESIDRAQAITAPPAPAGQTGRGDYRGEQLALPGLASPSATPPTTPAGSEPTRLRPC